MPKQGGTSDRLKVLFVLQDVLLFSVPTLRADPGMGSWGSWESGLRTFSGLQTAEIGKTIVCVHGNACHFST